MVTVCDQSDGAYRSINVGSEVRNVSKTLYLDAERSKQTFADTVGLTCCFFVHFKSASSLFLIFMLNLQRHAKGIAVHLQLPQSSLFLTSCPRPT